MFNIMMKTFLLIHIKITPHHGVILQIAHGEVKSVTKTENKKADKIDF